MSDNTWDWEPSVSLTADLDEPRKLGFCIDIKGYGQGINCDSLQAHSCKESAADTQFEYYSETKALRSVNYDANCESDPSANNRACVMVSGNLVDGATLGLAQCDDSLENQIFEAKESDDHYELRAGGTSTGLCVAVSDTTRIAGSYVARNLSITECSSTAKDLKTWTVNPTPPPTGPCTDSESDCCKNNSEFRYQNVSKKSCKWIANKETRRTKLCKKDAAKIGCPISCGSCCADDKTFKVRIGTKQRKCAYIARRPSRITKYCAKASIKSSCAQTCDYCFDPVQ